MELTARGGDGKGLSPSVHVTFVVTFAPAQRRRRLQWSELFPHRQNVFVARSTNLVAVSPIVAIGHEAESRSCFLVDVTP